MDDLLTDAERRRVVIVGDGLLPGHSRDPQSGRENGGMTRGPSPRGEDSLRVEDAVDVIGRGLQADQDDRLLLIPAHRLGFVRIERRESPGGSRRRGETACQITSFLPSTDLRALVKLRKAE